MGQITLYDHQEETRQFGRDKPALFDCSDPGTGKTIANLAIFADRFEENPTRRLLVLCPKSIMVLAWARDTAQAFPHLTYALAEAGRRDAGFDSKASIVIMNHDGITWLKDNMHVLENFTDLIVDESTAYKNRGAGRSKALLHVVQKHQWERRALLTGTPCPQSITDLWHQLRVLDDGTRLGKNFYAFQSSCCDAKQVGPMANHLEWKDKEGIEEVIMCLIEDITIRHKLEECIDIPPNQVITLPIELSKSHRAKYDVLRKQAVLELSSGTIDAFHAGVLRTKLLQLLSGAVYDDDKTHHLVDSDRYNLVLDIVEQRKASLVAFTWTHQRDEIAKIATKRGLKFAVMDGETRKEDRIKIVDAFQRGELNFILGHPKTIGHGVTLTYGTATIWPSPTDNAELFVQMNRRVYRNGQTAPTATILIAAENTLEVAVYERLLGKVTHQAEFLTLLESIDNSPTQPQTPPTNEDTP